MNNIPGLMDNTQNQSASGSANVSTNSDPTSGEQERSIASRQSQGAPHPAVSGTELSWESVAKRATTSSKHWHSKYFQAKEVAKKDRAQTQQYLEAKLNEKVGVIVALIKKNIESMLNERNAVINAQEVEAAFKERYGATKDL